MTNPEITTVTVTDVPTLVFSGCGKVKITQLSGASFVLGGANVAYLGGVATWFTSNPTEFKANAEVYAVCPNPGDSAVARVERWF